MIKAAALKRHSRVKHAFFTRLGGVSEGVYESLNCGFGSGDDAACIDANRARAMDRLGLGGEALVTVYQVHSPAVAVAEAPWPRGQAPQADGVVTRRPGLALGVLTADCVPVLFADAAGGVVGAAHAGWRGARAGVLEATVQAMVGLGAEAAYITAAIGPAIGRDSYEIGPEFHADFMAEDEANRDLFMPSPRPGHHMFDLPGYVRRRLARLALMEVEGMPHDTCADEDRFFSYRRATRLGESDYGRGLSAIVLAG